MQQERTYDKIIPKIIESSKKLIKELKKIKEEVSKTKITEKIVVDIKTDDLLKKSDDIYSGILNYLINNDIKELLFPFAYSSYLSETQNSLEKRANDETEIFAKEAEDKIQSIGKKLGLSKEISVILEGRKGMSPRLSMQAAEKGIKISNFSEGQRHKLALAVFFAGILTSNKKYDYLVLDDPMISLDVVTYHDLKRFILFDLNGKYDNSIILTHNLSFLLTMLSNVLRDKDLYDKTRLIELNSSRCDVVPIKTIMKDDIILFKDAIRNSKTMNDVSLWYWMTLKISRYFLDFNLSFKGLCSFDEVADDLAKLFKDDKLERAKNIMNDITQISKSTSSNMRSVISSLEKLNEFLNLLGSENLIEDDLLIKLKTDFNPEDKVTKTPEPKNLEFKILYEGYMVAFDDTKENSLLKGYLMHPRHQLSESLIAYQAQRDY